VPNCKIVDEGGVLPSSRGQQDLSDGTLALAEVLDHLLLSGDRLTLLVNDLVALAICDDA
jgi:hypothetical protein